MNNSDPNLNHNSSCLCSSKKQLLPHDFTRWPSVIIVVRFMLVSKIYKTSWLLREVFIKPVSLKKSSQTTRVLSKEHTFVESQTYVTEVNLPFFLIVQLEWNCWRAWLSIHGKITKNITKLLRLLYFRHQICKILLKVEYKACLAQLFSKNSPYNRVCIAL